MQWWISKRDRRVGRDHYGCECDIWNSILGNQSNRGRRNRKKETVESDLSLCFPATLKRFAPQMEKDLAEKHAE